MNEAKTLDKIRALIAKAQSTEHEAERTALFERAEQLMEKYSVDEALLEATRPAEARTKIDKLSVDICEVGHLEQQFTSLASAIALHFGCRIVFYGLPYKGQKYRFDKKVFATVVGRPSDLRLFEALYTSLYLDLASQLQPKPDVAKSFDANVYDLHAAGMSWRSIVIAMQRATNAANSGSISDFAPHTDRKRWPTLSTRDEQEIRKSGQRCKTAYRRHCRALGEEPVKVVSPVTYQRNFAIAYANRVSMRLWDLRSNRGGHIGTALALRADDVDSEFDKLFPPEEMVKGKSQKVRWNESGRAAGRAAGDRASLGGQGVSHSKRALDA